MLTPRQNTQADAVYDALVGEESRITTKMRDLETASGGKLVGLEFRIKGRDRFKEKLAKMVANNPNASVATLATRIHDGVRYTMTFDTADYAERVSRTMSQAERAGFEKDTVKNSWDEPAYKGVNTRWRDRASGYLLELQFHTPESFAAKQRTHAAYEKISNPQTPAPEVSRLERFCATVTRGIPVPPGWKTIRQYQIKGEVHRD